MALKWKKEISKISKSYGMIFNLAKLDLESKLGLIEEKEDE